MPCYNIGNRTSFSIQQTFQGQYIRSYMCAKVNKYTNDDNKFKIPRNRRLNQGKKEKL